VPLSATAANGTRNTVQGMFYKNQVLKRDEVFPHSLNVFFSSLFIRHNLVLRRNKYFISSLSWNFAIKIAISKSVVFVFPGAVLCIGVF
jgi:hypothetical protein